MNEVLVDPLVERGREAFARQAWGSAYASFSAADQQAPLALADLEALAVAAYLVGRDEDTVSALTRAHQESLRRGDMRRAARSGFWIAFALLNRGELARASGWLGRARRLLEQPHQDCVEQGYLLVIDALRAFGDGDLASAGPHFAGAVEIGGRFGDRDLVTLARFGLGHVRIMSGDIEAGVAMLDEAMVAVTTDDVSPIIAGVVYCGVIEACRDIFDHRRAREWTEALNRWCESQPDLVPYRGQCLVYRSEIMQLDGAWDAALSEARRARERLSIPPGQPAAANASYRLGELHRLRGEFAEAEQAYRDASRAGVEPMPGLALLRLAQGRIDAAAAAMRRAHDEARGSLVRARLLPANVEIMLAADDVPAARARAEELAATAREIDSPHLRAESSYATGALHLAEGDAWSALVALRQAWRSWQDLQVPYEAARARALIGQGCRALGDEDTGLMEMAAARAVLESLGAAPAVAWLDTLNPSKQPASADRLTSRELEVLALAATGKTNRDIAVALVISEHTVRRHLQNVFAKLGVSTRAAATAYAFQHHLL